MIIIVVTKILIALAIRTVIITQKGLIKGRFFSRAKCNNDLLSVLYNNVLFIVAISLKRVIVALGFLSS